MSEGSKIYHPYRALGLVSNGIPLVARYIKMRKEYLFVTAVGNTIHTYNEKRLGLMSVSNPHTSPLVTISADAYHIYTSCDKVIYALRRGSELKHKYVGHKADVHIMVPFGPFLIAVDKQNTLCLWDIKSETLNLEVEFNAKSFEITSVIHPATYINKVILGSKQGQLQLWNLNTSKLLYTFKGWDSEVVIMEQAPAIDVVAVGLANGRIILHNMKFDETVVEFKQDWGRVTGITFRTDGFPMMVTGSELGHIAQWDLQERRLVAEIHEAHDGPVAGIFCLANQPIMVTNSRDNTIKMWIFDMADGGGRLLKFRDGHGAPPLSVRFYGSKGNTLLTAGEDSTVRIFYAMDDALSRHLGLATYTGKKKKGVALEVIKMPPIIRFAAETTQDKNWDNLAAVHRGKAVVTTWSVGNQKMGEHRLVHERYKNKDFQKYIATCVEISVCGNFVIIGYDSGHMEKFNIQSGYHRGTYGRIFCHPGGVSDVVADGLNRFVVSGGQDGRLKWWRLSSCKYLMYLDLKECISKMVLHRESGLLAVILEDWSINIADVDTQSIVRKLYGHRNQVVDVTFSPDSKWLISASLDKTIRTWDIPSSTCVDSFLVPVPPTSLAMSPIGDFLVTIHADDRGVYLWANKGCYNPLSLRPLSENFVESCVSLPQTSADSSEMPEEDQELPEKPEVQEIEDDEEYYKSPAQVSEELVTLALLPTSRWLNLLHLDVIKKRNKPEEAPKVPKAAPFFLPTIPGLDVKFAAPDETDEGNKEKIIMPKSFEVLTDFGRSLKAEKYNDSLKMLMEMGASGIEVEIRSLDPNIGGSEELLVMFLDMLKHAFVKNMYFEAVQGYLSLFLKLHAEHVMNNGKVREMCETLVSAQQKSWHTMSDEIDQTLSLVSYLKNAALISF